MKRVCMLAVLALVAALVAAPASAAPTKWVRGPVTALAGDTITVTVKGVESTFKVEKTTELIARGAGTAQKTGPGPKLGDFVKVGQFVEIRYQELGSAKVATEIRPLATEEEGASKEKDAAVSTGASVLGGIVSVTMDSIVLKVDGADMKFTVTPKTKVLGPGMSTKARELTAAGKPTPITAFLGPNDQVVVYYAEGGGAPEASSIRVVVKVAK